MFRVLMIFSSTILFSFTAVASVWDAENSWNKDWEDKYSQWVKEEWHVGIFGSEKSRYYGIATDCADAGYAMRAIYAYENSLPFAYRDVSKYGNVISNKMSRWDKLSSLDRFKAFAGQFHITASTRTLPEDTVLVHVNPGDFRSGIIFVKPGKHSYQLQDITKYGIPVTIASTLPYKVRYLDRYESFPAYPLDDVKTYRDGYRRFKRPDELFKPDSELKGYTLFQHLISEGLGFDENEVHSMFRVQLTRGAPEPIAVKAKRLVLNVCYASRNRVDYVDAAVKYRQRIKDEGRDCMNYGEYDNYSTNSRDARFKGYFTTLKKFVESKKFKDHSGAGYKKYAKELFRRETGQSSLSEADYLKWCNVEIGDGQEYTVRDVWASVRDNKLVSNPNSTRRQRWGFTGKPFTTKCKVY